MSRQADRWSVVAARIALVIATSSISAVAGTAAAAPEATREERLYSDAHDVSILRPAGWSRDGSCPDPGAGVEGAQYMARLFQQRSDPQYVFVIRNPFCAGDTFQESIRLKASGERHPNLDSFFLANARGLEVSNATIVEKSASTGDRPFRRLRARIGPSETVQHYFRLDEQGYILTCSGMAESPEIRELVATCDRVAASFRRGR